MQATSAMVREFDGGRTVEMAMTPGMVYMDTGDHCYAFDAGLFVHAMKKVLGIAFVVNEVATVGSPYTALPEP